MTTKNYGTYRNQYGKLVHDRGPTQGQEEWITRLRAEKILSPRAEELIALYDVDDLSGQAARELLDILFAAKSVIVLPSTLGPQDPNAKLASDKQVNWVLKLLDEKDVPESEAVAITGYMAETLTGRHAGRILDYLFDRPNQGAPAPAQGFVGQIGEQVSVTGELVVFKKIPSKFGETNLIVVRDQAGREVKAFSNAKSFWGLHQGETITINGTVKAHEEYKGAESTVLARPQAVYGEGSFDEDPTPFQTPEEKEFDQVQVAAEKADDLLGYWGLK